MIALVLFLTAAVQFSSTALPQFSWDTMPVFFHSCNTSGQYNDESVKIIAKFQMATVEKSMGRDLANEDVMATYEFLPTCLTNDKICGIGSKEAEQKHVHI